MMKYLWPLLLFSCFAVAAEENISNWRDFSSGSLISETTGVAPGHKAQIGLWLKMAKDWHTYWVNPGDSGEALFLKVGIKPAAVTVSEVKFPVPKRFDTENLVSFAYEKEVLIPIEFMVPKGTRIGSDIQFKVEAEWLICHKVCIPAIDHFTISVPVAKLENIKPSANFALFQRVQDTLPVASTDQVQITEGEDRVRLKFPGWTNTYEFLDFLPYRGAGLKNVKPTVISRDPLELEFRRSKVKKSGVGLGLLLMKTPGTKLVNAWTWGASGWSFTAIVKNMAKDLWWILLSAFIGGFILNSMPCVFPILSMKLLSLVKLSHSSHGHVVRQNVAYTVGVIVSFLAIALMILGLRQSGQLVGWGFQLQSPVFVSFLVWLFILLSLQLLGLFEIDFLDLSVGHGLTKKQGWMGSFFTGVLAVIVASPCTAPFMGVAIGFALVAQWWVLLAIFFMLGLGLAFPYLAFSLFPPVVRYLPRPGPWMIRFKQIMSIPLALTSLWLLWLVGQLTGMVGVGFVLLGCVALFMSVWLVHSSRKRQNRTLAWMLSGIVIGLCAGGIYMQDGRSASQSDGPWQPYYVGIEERNKGRTIFIDFTADWCLACKVNEKVVLDTAEIQRLFKEHNVLLVKGDWTQRNPEITNFLRRYERAGVPFYIVFSPKYPDGKILPEVLTKDMVIDAIK